MLEAASRLRSWLPESPVVPFVAAMLLLGFVTAPSLLAEEAGEGTAAKAQEVLEKADAAIKKIEAIRFESKIAPTGIAANFFFPSEGGGVISGWDGQLPEYFHVKLTTTMPGAEEATSLEGGGTPEMYFLIDHSSKKAYEDMDPGVFGSAGNSLNSLAMVEYVHSAPFDDELGAETKTYDGKEEVGGVPCHKVTVVYTGGRGKSTWYFGGEDYLPRRRVRHFDTPQGAGTVDLVLTELELDPEIDPSIYNMKLPEGYEQIDDFAP